MKAHLLPLCVDNTRENSKSHLMKEIMKSCFQHWQNRMTLSNCLILSLRLLRLKNSSKQCSTKQKTFESILSEEKTTNFENFDQILQKSHETRSEKIFDTLNSSISRLRKAGLFSQLDASINNQAEAESQAGSRPNQELSLKLSISQKKSSV
jgi:hypothetical protein